MKDLTIIKQELPVIEVNFEEIKQELTEQLQGYKGLIVTDESLGLCKEQQKSLAGLRIKIDNYRKDVKKEMSKPIDAFETKCKELVKLIEDAEKPIKDGIAVFDNKKREEKRQAALKIIAETIEKHNINEKYASQLTVVDKYMNLTAKPSEVREDVEQRAFALVGQQQKEAEMLEIIQDTIDNVNKTIKKQLSISDFQRLIDMGMSPKEVIQQINANAERIREAENPKPVEPVVEVPTISEAPKPPVIEEKTTQDLYYVEMRVVETKENVAKLGQWLRDNNYNYKVIAKGAVE